MKKLVIITISVLFLLGGCATNSIPQKAQKVNIEAIIDNTNMKEFFEKIEKIKPSETSKNYEKKALNFKVFQLLAAKYFTYEQIKPDLINEFSKNFTESELLEISRFVQSDANKKYYKIYPKLLKEISGISKFLLTENKNKLSKMIQNRLLEIKSKKNLLNILLKNQKEFSIKREHKTYSSSENKSQAEIMFENPAFEELYLSAIEKGINQQIKQKNYMILYKDIIEEYIEKHLSYSDAKPYFIKVFRENFTENELYEINKFDTSEVGKKYFKFLPTLRKYVQTLFLKMIIEHSSELVPLLKEEKLKMKESLQN